MQPFSEQASGLCRDDQHGESKENGPDAQLRFRTRSSGEDWRSDHQQDTTGKRELPWREEPCLHHGFLHPYRSFHLRLHS